MSIWTSDEVSNRLSIGISAGILDRVSTIISAPCWSMCLQSKLLNFYFIKNSNFSIVGFFKSY